MAVIAEKRKTVEKCESSYIPHKIRSHPFYFINLPFLGTLITMFYWLIQCPLAYSLLFGYHCCGTALFWIAELIVFIVILSILVCVWRCSPKKKRREFYTITVEDSEDVGSTNDLILKEIPSKEPDQAKTTESAAKIDETDQDKMFPRCSVRQKSKNRPSSITIVEEDRPVSQNLSSPLTPRELFFIDLIESSNKSVSSVTHTFIERERQNCSSDDLSVRPCSEERQKSCSPSEFFIANVPEEKSCTAEAFLFVDGPNPEREFRINFETDDVFDD